jgi:hypothetical protein
MGMDIPDIRVIFHIGVPWTLLDYAPESGQASEAIIIQPDKINDQSGSAGDDHQ